MIAWPPPPCPCVDVSNVSAERRRRNHGRRGIFGNPLQHNHQSTIRILMQNVGGLGFIANKRCHETLKMEKIKEITIKYNVDLLALTETNKDWRTVKSAHTIWEGTKGWKDSRRIQVAHNTTQQAEGQFVSGGTAMCAFDKLVYGIYKQGFDDRKLGRWSYITIEGKF